MIVNIRTVDDVTVEVHRTRNVDVLASRDADPDWFAEGTLLVRVRVVGAIILGTVGVRTTLPPWELVYGVEFVAVVLVVFEREGFGLPLGSFLLGFGVHVISFPTG